MKNFLMMITFLTLTALPALAGETSPHNRYFSCVRPADGVRVTSRIGVWGNPIRLDNVDSVDRDVPYVGYPSAPTGWSYEYDAKAQTISISFFADSRKPTRPEDQGTFSVESLESGIAVGAYVCSVSP